tara:strand:- start:652 stop:1932 length:1281 start_codon:yes stop_codon:yes gene_type:complete
MNGINNIEVNNIEFPDGSTISSANNLVQLDTNNNFTGNNTYNTNLPTSTKTPTIGDINNNTMLNKFSADLLYAGTDENDYTTAFTRNGTTGEITLTTADTGTPLSGDTSITGITDAQITAIGTNTTAISNNASNISTNASNISTNTGNITTNASNISTLTTTTNSCFDTASFSTPTLTLTDVAGNDTNINIGGGGSGDAVLSGGTVASPQVFSGINSMTVESTPANTGKAINQFYGDANYGAKLDFGFAQLLTSITMDIAGGNASASNPDQFDGAVFELSVDITPIKSGARVLLNYEIVGEWEYKSWDTLSYIAVGVVASNGTVTYNRALRPNTAGNRGLGIAIFNVSQGNQNNDSTMEQTSGQFIDQSSSLNPNQTYRYTPVLVVTSTAPFTPNKFFMNRTKGDGNVPQFERGCSSFVAQILGYV